MEVFISYSHEDVALVEQFEHLLKESGLIVHRDKSTLEYGDDWRERLFSTIRTCDRFVLIWSTFAARSPHVMEEIVEAIRYERRVLPCLTDDTKLIPLLESRHYFELRDVAGQFNDLVASFGLEIETLPAEVATDFKYALATYKAVMERKYSQLQVLFPGKERAIDAAYIQLSLAPGLEPDKSRSGVDPRELLTRLADGPDNYILAGHPGTGKTSTLHYLLHSWSVSDAHYLAIYARLKDFEPRFHSTFAEFIQEQFFVAQSPQIRRIFDRFDIFADHRCVILLDGLDEVPAGNYRAFIDALNEFMGAYRQCSVVITTRIDGFRDKREDDFLGWNVLSIAKLDEPRIRAFVSLWLQSPEREQVFLKLLRNPRLADLAGRAFLLALMCLVFEEDGTLGQNRSALYEQATLYLEQSRSGKLPNRILERRREVLKAIALTYLQLNTDEMSEKLLAAMVSAVLMTDSSLSARAFIEETANDTGILQSLGGTYVFTHKSFKEYYAALALADIVTGQEILLDYAHVSQWEETIRLYAGSLVGGMEQESFISALWKKNPALALRTATECHQMAPTFLGNLIVNSSPENRRRMISEVQDSLRSIDAESARRVTIETLQPLFARETDSAVLYFGIKLLDEFDPGDTGGILFETFYRHADSTFQVMIANLDYKFTFVRLPSGWFTMGDDKSPDKIEHPAHRVYLDAFDVCKYQLTNLAYEAIMGKQSSRRDPATSDKDDQPVVNLNWYDAFICALKVGCRLPTEAEWEYMARAGSTGDYCFGNSKRKLRKYCNFEDSGIRRTWAVGSGLPNSWGIYDAHGNVWEWCQDWLDTYGPETQTNPKGPVDGTRRVRRGGGHAYHARGCRSAFRWGNDPAYSFKDIGVRFVRDVRPEGASN